jgi:hypothetical protein
MTQYNLFPLSRLPHAMLTFAKAHLYPLWILHSSTCKHEIESPLQEYVLQLVNPLNDQIGFCGARSAHNRYT